MCTCVHVCLYNVFLVSETYLYQMATWGAATTGIYGEVAALHRELQGLVAHWFYLGPGRPVILHTYVCPYVHVRRCTYALHS